MTVSLPNGHCAGVSDDKVVKYLLNSAHNQGAAKAKFFTAFGFQASDWRVIQSALVVQGQSNPVVETTVTEFGPRYEVLCHCPSPDGRNPCIRTVWQVTADEPCPELITAIPK